MIAEEFPHLDTNGDGVGDECQCGDFGDRSTIPIQSDGFVTNTDIAGAVLCANDLFEPDPVLGTIQQCDAVFLDTDAKTMIAGGNPNQLIASTQDERIQRFLTRGDTFAVHKE